MGYVIGTDIGGTFTDCVIVDSEGQVVTGKASTTPGRLHEGLLAAVGVAARRLGHDVGNLLGDTDHFLHSSTIATNALIERRGATVGLIATRGHGDAILMMLGQGRSVGLSPDEMLRFSTTDKPTPIVPRSLIREVSQRNDCMGNEVVGLDEAGVRQAITELREAGADALAISYLWSFLAPDHEERTLELVRELWPECFVTSGSQLIPRYGEYERTVAAALNAYLGPGFGDYVDGVDRAVREAGLRGSLLIMHSSGGALSVEDARERPLLTYQSGPVAGVRASQRLGAEAGIDRIITADVGGTSFDVGMIVDGFPVMAGTQAVSQYQFYLSAIDVQSIGAGGGSIAHVDEVSRSLLVGPQSAGAEPGPACYGRGGVLPTVTDANLVLGYIDPAYFLGGELKLDLEAARTAVEEHVARPLKITVDEAAAGIIRIADHHMADLIRRTTITRGHDPRRFTIFAYGGAGGLHCASFARGLGVKQVVVPAGRLASVWSALGTASSDAVVTLDASEIMYAPFDVDRLAGALERLRLQAESRLRAQGLAFDLIDYEMSAGLRYVAQANVVDVPVPAVPQDAAGAQALVDVFGQRYRELYGEGAGFEGAGVEIGTLRVQAIGRIPKPTLATGQLEESDATPSGERKVWSSVAAERVATPIFRADDLRPGGRVSGPAILEFPDTTILLSALDNARLDARGSVWITPREEVSMAGVSAAAREEELA